MTKQFTRRFTALPCQQREALIDTKEARFLKRLARELEALGPAMKPPPSPRDRAIRQASGRWQTGKETPKSRASWVENLIQVRLGRSRSWTTRDHVNPPAEGDCRKSMARGRQGCAAAP